MLDLIKRLVKEEEGQGMVEYGLIIALISIVLIVALSALAGGEDDTGLTGIFKRITDELDSANTTE